MSNFMSFAEEAFDFSMCNGMNLVQGKNNDIPGSKNGTGKSQLFSSLLYALFGQLQSKIKNENLVTKPAKGKDMDLSLVFSVDGIGYKVRRGMTKGKSSYLELFKEENNDYVDITKSTIAETQDFIEKDLLHCDITMFLRTMLLTSDQTYNFYMLKKADKKEFVEKMFDISVFEEMHQALHKDALASDKESIACQNRLFTLNKTNEDYESRRERHETSQQAKMKVLSESVESLKKKLNEVKSVEVKTNVDAIKKLEDEIEKIEKEIDEFDKTYDNAYARLNEAKSKASKIDLGICKFMSLKESKQQLLDKNKDIIDKLCNDCKPIFMRHYSLDKISEEMSDAETKIKKLNSSKIDIDRQISKDENEISNIKTKQNETKKTLSSSKMKMKQMLEESTKANRAIMLVESELKDAENNFNLAKNAVNPYVELIEKCKQDIDDEVKSMSKIELKLKYLKFAENIVSQDTLRKFIIKDLVVLLNNKIKTYLTKLGAKYYVVFDEDMDYEFMTPGGSCEWSNFSAGERMRIMIATSFAFRDFMSIRNGLNANILILDEYFDSAIDSLCVESILNILKDYSLNQGQNIFVISHRPEVSQDMFDRTILVEKTNGASKVRITSK